MLLGKDGFAVGSAAVKANAKKKKKKKGKKKDLAGETIEIDLDATNNLEVKLEEIVKE
jgi:hypothetical protein